MYTPTKRLDIVNPDEWEAEARAFAEQIAESEGTRRPCFELRYPAPAQLDDDEAAAWLARQDDTFDAICVDLDDDSDAAIVTLPPYSELTS